MIRFQSGSFSNWICPTGMAPSPTWFRPSLKAQAGVCKMSLASRKLDPFLIQAIPKFKAYVKLIESITSKTLLIQQVIQLRVIAVTIVVYVSKTEMPSGQVPLVSAKQERQARFKLETQKEALTLCECVAVFNKKLRDVVTKELELEKTLREKGSSLDRKIKKLTELHSSVNEFTVLVDKILAYYTGRPMGLQVDGLPSVDELNNAKNKLIALKKSLKHEELYGLFSRYDSDFITNQTSILLATVGINDESYGSFLFSMDENMKMHQTELYYLEKILTERANVLGAAEETTRSQGKEALQKNLQKLGFTAESSKTIATSIPDELVDLQSSLFWALRFLRHAFQHHPLLTEHSRYIYQTEKTDHWFTEEIRDQGGLDEEDGDGDHHPAFPVKMINIATNSGRDEVVAFLREREKTTDCHIFYHGTTHESAKSIIEDGITLTKGRDCQDFSSGDGFYVSEKFENAKEWSRASRGENQAVIVYTFQSQQWDEAYGRDLTSSKQEWEDIVRLCRDGYKNKAIKKRLLGNLDYIRGPLCRNPKMIKNTKPQGFGRNDDIQVCIRGEDFAEKFGALSNILCVIFL
ncbi:unnamed protein product [Lymnaea stagnalis]|uniref:DUF3990 domain-containing protein n=1 Tax=Lymnaea stagnalis TaxID=6523 RepID=A0AAV2I1T6_LYMST